MELRNHPLMSYLGLPNWPPVWTWRGEEKKNKRVYGEIGVLKDVFPSRIEPKSRIFLVIEYENERYISCLLFSNGTFCEQICAVLKDCIGDSIAAIGGLEIGYLS